MISLEKWYNLTPLQKLPKIVGDLGQLIVAIGFKKLPKVQQIAKSGHTATVTECTKLQVKATWGTAAYIITLYANRCIKSIKQWLLILLFKRSKRQQKESPKESGWKIFICLLWPLFRFLLLLNKKNWNLPT